jgi:hypothetical protein
LASGWLTRDPIGYAGGINLYAFCGNNPVNRIDPWGFCGDGDGYWHQVGQVFMGYGDAVNPLNWYNGLVGLYGVATNKGLGAAGGALLGGVEHMVTGLGSGDPREFGQTLGGDLLVAGTAAAGGLGGAGEAAEEGGAEAGSESIVIGKVRDLNNLGEGERTLDLPDMGSPKANWDQNAGRLRQEMGSGRPIRDASLDRFGELTDNTGFLRAERNLLSDHGWVFDPTTGCWIPGG